MQSLFIHFEFLIQKHHYDFYLNISLSNELIGLRGEIEWPASWPDLNPFDLSYSGTSFMYSHHIRDKETMSLSFDQI